MNFSSCFPVLMEEHNEPAPDAIISDSRVQEQQPADHHQQEEPFEEQADHHFGNFSTEVHPGDQTNPDLSFSEGASFSQQIEETHDTVNFSEQTLLAPPPLITDDTPSGTFFFFFFFFFNIADLF